jgi:Na+/H+ antiporter NhaC
MRLLRTIIPLVLVLCPVLIDPLPLEWFWPPLVGLICILLTGNAFWSLLAGSFSGVLILSNGHIWQSYLSLFSEHLSPLFTSSWKLGSLTFTILLGGFAVMLEKSGAFHSLLEMLAGRKRDKKRVEYAAAFTGLLCFFDGLASNLMIGKLNRGLFDEAKIPRARLAYISDTTGSCVACIAIFSTWIATQMSLIEEGLNIGGMGELGASSYWLFIQSIPYNFYSFFALAVLFFAIGKQVNLGAMKKSVSYTEFETEQDPEDEHQGRCSIKMVIIPLIVLTVSILVGFYWDGTEEIFPVTGYKISMAFSEANAMLVLNFSAFLAIAVTFIYGGLNAEKLTRNGKHFAKGCQDMFAPLAILIAAWMLGSVMSKLGTTQHLAEWVSDGVSPSYFPLIVFCIGMILSFTTGTSWGTMGLLMPICLPLCISLNQLGVDSAVTPLLVVIGAVFSGAVFGDHCSPFSDTTIVSSIASGVSPVEHIKTQLPYAFLGAVVTVLFGFIPSVFGLHWSFSYLMGAGIIFMFFHIYSKKVLLEK